MNKRLDLCGTWKLCWFDGMRGQPVTRMHKPDADLSRALDAAVPGEVHQTLIEHGWIEEPTVGLNCLHARWVEETTWHYRRTFVAPRPVPGAPPERVWLVCEGLDLAAVIYLNGKEIGRHANYFYPCRLEVTDALVKSTNVLVIQVESGLIHAADRPGQGYGADPLTKRPWLRKTQSSFGWDWSPRLLNVGIHGKVYLERAAVARWDGLTVLSELSEDLETGTLTARVFAEGLGSKPQQGVLTVTVAETGETVRANVEVKPGANTLEATLTVKKPRLWWPVGHGAQPRYTVTAALTVGGRPIGSDLRRIGFRRVRINQDPHPQAGRYFILEINGKPIFVKGGNFVPADIIFTRIDRQRYDTLTDRALEANCNLLRIWGGGLYEGDDFYDLCDEKGILVWQEFIFACAKYPATDEKYLADVKNEATHQIRRLAHHPSLVVWCGNNELEWGSHAWGYEKGVAHPDYALFHLVLPGLLKREDPTRYYHPSSPYSPDHEFPNRDDMGDQHPWSVGMINTDFREYRKMMCRFPNEGGILGPNALATVRACLPKGFETPGSLAWEIHDNSVTAWGEKRHPDYMLEQWLGRRFPGSMSVEDYVYWAGLVQGEALSEYIKNFHRRMFDSASAIFWMYNDCWPTVRSWTIVDYYRRRTPAFYPVRRAFAPLTVVVSRDDDTVRIWGVNEGASWNGTLRYGLMTLAGGYPIDRQQAVALPGNASTELAQFDAKAWDRRGVTTHGAFALLLHNDREIARDRLFLPMFKEMKWPKPRLSVRWQSGQAIFRSDTFVWRVCLDLDGEQALPDNFFDVFPGIPTVLPWPKRFGRPKVLRVGNQ